MYIHSISREHPREVGDFPNVYDISLTSLFVTVMYYRIILISLRKNIFQPYFPTIYFFLFLFFCVILFIFTYFVRVIVIGAYNKLLELAATYMYILTHWLAWYFEGDATYIYIYIFVCIRGKKFIWLVNAHFCQRGNEFTTHPSCLSLLHIHIYMYVYKCFTLLIL